jgi:hypothetical protein
MIRNLFHLAVRPFRGRDAVDREISFHLELQVEDLVQRGWTREAAGPRHTAGSAIPDDIGSRC